MNWIFEAITNRVKALFAQAAAFELEAQAATFTAECKANLLRRAEQYRQEGLSELAEELETRAENITTQQPLSSVLPALEHWDAKNSSLATSKSQIQQIEAPKKSTKQPVRRKKATRRK